MTLGEQIRQVKYPYNPELVARIIESNRKKYGGVTDNAKVLIFTMMDKVVAKAIRTFYRIMIKRHDHISHEDDDIIDELYFTLSVSCNNYQVGNFYIYFNTAAQRRIERVVNQKEVLAGGNLLMIIDKPIPYHEDTTYEYLAQPSNNHTANSWFETPDSDQQESSIFNDLRRAGLDEVDVQMTLGFYSGEKKQDIAQRLNLTRKDYARRKQKIESTVLKLYGYDYGYVQKDN